MRNTSDFLRFRVLINELNSVKPIDLMSDKTTKREAVNWAKSIFNTILNSGITSISDENKEEFSDKLKRLGALNLSQLKESPFFENGKSLGKIISERDSVTFPLSAMAQLVGTDNSTFDYGFAKTFEGDKYSWASEWLSFQKEKSDDEKFVDMLKDLDKIKPINLMSEKTTMKEAVEWAKSIAYAITDNEVTHVSDENKILVSEKLKELGALNFENLKKSRFFGKGQQSVGDIMSEKNSIEFPLSAMAQLIDTENSTFNMGFELAFTGGKYSWINEWLEAQNAVEEERE